MLYISLKRIFQYALEQYFSSITVLHKERIPMDTPLLVLPNHRSAYMDPIVVAALIKPKLYFIARGESFAKKYLARLFTALYMIPIYRKQFSPDEVYKNEDVFKHCYNLLEKKGALMIFPEGISHTKFKLYPIKTGAARIALGAEEKNDYGLDIHLLPIGINYTNPHTFRGSVVLDIGEPIKVVQYRDLFEASREDAVRKLTADIKTQLEGLTLTLDKNADTDLIRRTELLFSHDLGSLAETSQDDWYGKRKIIVGSINYFRDHSPSELLAFKKRVSIYLDRANLIDPKAIEQKDIMSYFGIRGQVLRWLFLLLTLPLYLIGLITHLLPFTLTKMISIAVVKRPDFTGSTMFAFGLLIFSLFGIAETWAIYSFTNSGFIAAVFLLIWPTLGLFTYTYFNGARINFKRFFAWLRTRDRKQLHSYLRDERDNLLTMLNRAFQQYQDHQLKETKEGTKP